ncbi:hypothetical protein [Prauserella rugosa]|uniref:Uncharacterized protein n=1 Tax=Prauserella rugosa TaxID=43354 RepID=A0A660C8K9_9PSEU|nr:hypothetical protein [Prauserella rugosa]TWH15979.1 hypothetical protein JD82_04967 [Prauserella rugosa]
MALERGTDWTREALTTVFAATQAAQRPHNHDGLLNQARRQLDAHLETAEKIRAALEVLGNLNTTTQAA